MQKTKIQTFIESLLLTIKSIVKILILSKKNKVPQKEKENSDCIVLMNGPSLNKTIDEKLTFLQGKKTICANHFAVTDYYSKLEPQIYILNAPEFWLDDVDKIYKQKRNDLFKAIKEKTKWDLILYIGVEAKKNQHLFNKLKQNNNIKIYFFNNIGLEGLKNAIFYFFKKRLGMPRPHNVLIPSLMLAINSGFKNIYIAGADHDWIQNISVGQDNKVYLVQKHFYDKDIAKPAPMKILGKGERKLHEVLEKFTISLGGYFLINEFAEKNNSHIYNITPNSFIDAFERKII